MNKVPTSLPGRLPFLKPFEAFVLRIFMIPVSFLVRASGLEHIRERNGPVIFAFNHNNSIETLLVPACLVYHGGGKKISFIVDWMFGKIPLLDRLFNVMEPIYVYHKRSPLAVLESRRPKTVRKDDAVSLCCQKLKEGRHIGIFPEGKRNRDPEKLLRAKPGIGHISLRSGMPVIPVGINCVSGKKKKKVRTFGRIRLAVGKPLQFDALSEAYRRIGTYTSTMKAERERHKLAREAADRIMTAIASLSGKEYVCSSARAGMGNASQETVRNNNHHTIKEATCPV